MRAAVALGTAMLALLLACGSAQAAEWVLIGGTDQGHRGYIDTSSVRVSSNIRRAWFKSIVAPHTVKETNGPNADKWWTEVVSLEAHDCSAETNSREASTVYYEDGSNFSGSPAAYPSK
jgi:hypothetical protein